jgi:glycine cleavage system transcriptional repressor
MSTPFILTLTGPDRVGIVGEVTGLLLERGGNVETSRMSRLGGEFAVLMLVTIPETHFERLASAFDGLKARGYRVSATQAGRPEGDGHAGWLAYRVEVRGADHEGIIHEVARYLSSKGISIESAESESAPASTSGVPLFAMNAEVIAPPGLSEAEWRAGLDEIGARLNLDVSVVPSRQR